jgi:beta-lactamase regulating signal transducer with metallopeptidase domain
MQILSHIPAAILHNIGFMSVLYLLYILIKQFAGFSARHLFVIAVGMQIISSIDFFYFLVASPQLDILDLQNLVFSSNWYSSYANQFFPYIGGLYFICLLFFMSRLIYSFLQLSVIQKTANYTDSAKWKLRLGTTIHKNASIQIGYSHLVTTPVTFGWLDPIILMPFSICNQLSIEQVKTILLHELAHIIRYDYIIHIFIKCCHACLHFNPFSYLLMKEISLQREIACDRWVIQQNQDPLVYTQALYNIGVNATNNATSLLFINAINQPTELLIRIKKMNQLKVASHFTSPILSYLVIAFVGTFMLLTSSLMQLSNWSKNASGIKPILANTIQRNTTRNSLSTNESKVNTPIRHNATGIAKLTKQPNKLNRSTEVNHSNELIVNNVLQENNLALVHEKMHSPVYAKLVDETISWIKAHETLNQFSAYDNNYESAQFTIAEKLLLRTILKNYQLKRALLNDKLNKIQDEKDATELLKNNKEYQQVLQYENWTKEFLQKHPGSLPILDSVSQY